jgi:hypothetical protein
LQCDRLGHRAFNPAANPVGAVYETSQLRLQNEGRSRPLCPPAEHI